MCWLHCCLTGMLMAECSAGFVETSLYKRFPRQAWLQYDLFAKKVTSQGHIVLASSQDVQETVCGQQLV